MVEHEEEPQTVVTVESPPDYIAIRWPTWHRPVQCLYLYPAPSDREHPVGAASRYLMPWRSVWLPPAMLYSRYLRGGAYVDEYDEGGDIKPPPEPIQPERYRLRIVSGELIVTLEPIEPEPKWRG